MTWSVGIFSSRETPEILGQTLSATIRAAGTTPTTIDVIVNGASQLAQSIAHYTETIDPIPESSSTVRVWDFQLGDKANAWNHYLQEIWPANSDIGFFIDGYVRVKPDALSLIAEGLENAPEKLGGSGVPTVGRTARQQRERMLREGYPHGNLYSVSGNVMRTLRENKFHLPLGIYRTDPLLFSAISFGLDPAKHDWDPRRHVLVHPQATWDFNALKWWKPADLRTHLKRRQKQAQGTFETRAIHQHLAVQKRDPYSFPETCSELVQWWIRAAPDEARELVNKSKAYRLAAEKVQTPRDWSQASIAPQLLTAIAVARPAYTPVFTPLIGGAPATA